MTKGTTSQGPRHLKAHTFCRRCGRRAFHRQKKKKLEEEKDKVLEE